MENKKKILLTYRGLNLYFLTDQSDSFQNNDKLSEFDIPFFLELNALLIF